VVINIQYRLMAFPCALQAICHVWAHTRLHMHLHLVSAVYRGLFLRHRQARWDLA
jgi:hypothetical protein